MHALIIEDQFLIAMLIEEELREIGYTSFDIADREPLAVEAARLRVPDLVTADDRLAEGTGVSAAKAICEREPVPVIFIVGNPYDVAPLVGDAVLIGKPFGGERLRQAVADAVMFHRRTARQPAPAGANNWALSA